jgi:SAM-dependent methyltransferase
MSASGEWRVTMSTPMGDAEATLLLEVDEGSTSFTGTMSSPLLGTSTIQDGIVSATGSLSWSATVTVPFAGSVSTQCTARISEGGTMSGEVSSFVFGAAPFRGERVRRNFFREDGVLTCRETAKFSVLELAEENKAPPSSSPSSPPSSVPRSVPASAAPGKGVDPLGTPDMPDGGFVGSRLGTKEHWDGAYDREIDAFAATSGEDYGEVWFGEDTLERSVEFVLDMVDEFGTGAAASGSAASRAEERSSCPVLDVGCGNATTMIALAAEGFQNIVGSDYSRSSIDLSSKVLAHAGLDCRIIVTDGSSSSHGEQGAKGVLLVVDDVLASRLAPRSFGLVVDKGTLDAIGLHPTTGARDRQAYLKSIAKLLRPGGLLVITSCNSTTEELSAEVAGFTNEGSSNAQPFSVLDHVRYPTFEYGGVKGQRVSTVAFRAA